MTSASSWLDTLRNEVMGWMTSFFPYTSHCLTKRSHHKCSCPFNNKRTNMKLALSFLLVASVAALSSSPMQMKVGEYDRMLEAKRSSTRFVNLSQPMETKRTCSLNDFSVLFHNAHHTPSPPVQSLTSCQWQCHSNP